MPKSRRRWTSWRKEREDLPFIHLSVPMHCMMPAHTGALRSAYLVYRSKCSSLPETPSQTHPEVMFYRLSGHLSVKTTYNINIPVRNSSKESLSLLHEVPSPQRSRSGFCPQRQQVQEPEDQVGSALEASVSHTSLLLILLFSAVTG